MTFSMEVDPSVETVPLRSASAAAALVSAAAVLSAAAAAEVAAALLEEDPHPASITAARTPAVNVFIDTINCFTPPY